MSIIGDMACPSCREQGRDKTGNHLMLYSDGGAYCNRCGFHTKDVTRIAEEDWKDIMTGHKSTTINNTSGLGLADITRLKSTKLPSRRISSDTAKKYGVKTSVDPSSGEIDKHYYPITKNGNLVAYKVREVANKRFTTIGDAKGKVDFFGQSAMPKSGKRIMITAGEEDAMAGYEMLKRKYPDSNPIVVSVPKGESSAKTCVADQVDYLDGFEEVLVYMDMDEAGQKASMQICQLLGEKARIVETSEKDASDMYLSGKSKEFISAFFNAKQYAPEGFVTIDDIFDEATAMPTWGKPWPWPELSKLTYGRRLGEGYYFGAGVKIGKSECVNQLAQWIIEHEKSKVALFKLEEKPAMTARRIAGKIKHKQFHKPDGDFTQEELIDGVNAIRGGVVLYDRYGSTSWDELKSAIRHAVVVEGVQDIVIDPLSRLTAGMTASDANTELERIADEISSLAKDLQFTYYIFCHLKAPLNGRPHEEGGRVHSNQFTGSRAMMRACYYMIGIERDKSPDLPDVVRNMSSFVLLEDRAFGNSGRFNVYYNNLTGDYLEPDLDVIDEYNELRGA